MKRLTAPLALLVALIVLAGCVMLPPAVVTLDTVRVISAAGYIYRPLMGGGDDWTVHPANKETMSFATGKDAYGNPTGLSDDEVWNLEEVHIQLDEKVEEDTLFWPSNLGPNECVWFPGWTAPMEGISGLPYPMYPLTGYPWDSCQTLSMAVMPGQLATITASARVEWIELEFELPTRSDGEYTLDLPGYTPSSSNVLTVRLGAAQTVTTTCTVDGAITDTWIFVIPVDWFWINGSWEIPVGPSGVCL